MRVRLTMPETKEFKVGDLVRVINTLVAERYQYLAVVTNKVLDQWGVLLLEIQYVCNGSVCYVSPKSLSLVRGV